MKCKTKQRLELTLYLTGLITQVTTHSGKDVEQGEHSSIAAGNANLYSNFVNQYGSSSDS